MAHMDDFDKVYSDSKPVSSIDDCEREELIKFTVRNMRGLQHRIVESMAAAALDYAAEQGMTIAECWRGPLSLVKELESEFRHAVNYRNPFGEISEPEYWVHRMDIIARVGRGEERAISTEAVEYVAEQYLNLPFRAPDFERLLVDALIASEMYAYFIEAVGSKAKANRDFGFSSSTSLLIMHPLRNYIRSILTNVMIVGGVGGSISIALAYFSLFEAFIWSVAATVVIFAWVLIYQTFILPRSWRHYAKHMAQGNKLIRLMHSTYWQLSGSGVVSTRRLREVATQAEDEGVFWPSSLFAVLDDNIKRTGQLAAPIFRS
ncbi:MAG: hypothetical protein ACR2PG_05930 [Hyphomicrobiaceae bacterium]